MSKKKEFGVVVAHALTPERRGIIAALKERGQFKIVGETDNGVDCLRMVREFWPDMVILDTVLCGMDGLGVIGQLHAQPGERCVKCLLLSNCGGFVQKQAIEMGADYFMLTPCAYTEIANRAIQILTPQQVVSMPVTDQEIEQETRRLLRSLAAPRKLKGVEDAVAGVRMLVRDWNYIYYVTGELYANIGALRNADWRAVEHTLRTLVNNIWSKAPRSALEDFFGANASQTMQPTSSDFLAMLAERVEWRAICIAPSKSGNGTTSGRKRTSFSSFLPWLADWPELRCGGRRC